MFPPFLRRLWPLALLAVVAPALFLLWRPVAPPPPAPRAPRPQAEAPPARAVTPASAPATSAPAAPPAPAAQPELDAALAIADAPRRAQEFLPKFAALIARDAEAALAYLRTLRRGPEYTQGLFLLIDHFGRRDPDRALGLAAELAAGRDEFSVFALLFSRFAQDNPALALERLPRVPAGEPRDTALRTLVDTWVRLDPGAAVAWARQLPDPADRNLALESVLRDLAARDPAGAIAQARETLTGASLERVLQIAFQLLSLSDPARASQLLQTIPPGDVQTLAVMDVARSLATRNVEGALAWSRTLTIDFTQWLALTSILSVWAQKDPLAAARYVMELPPGPTLDYVAGQFAGVLAQKPQEAILWADALPSPSAREAACVTIASTWAQRAPADAIRWAETLEGEPLRTNALAGAHAIWRILDPRAAQTWLDAAPLPPAVKSRILAPR